MDFAEFAIAHPVEPAWPAPATLEPHLHGTQAKPARAMYFPENAAVYQVGDSANAMYTVTAGVMRACHFLADGRRQITAFYHCGDMFGFDLTERRSHTVEAVCAAAAQPHWDRSVLCNATEDRELAAETLMAIMASLKNAVAHGILLGQRTAREKLAWFLLQWFDRAGRIATLELPMTREDIGDYLGMTSETVSRQFAVLQAMALISVVTPRRVVLQRPAELRGILG